MKVAKAAKARSLNHPDRIMRAVVCTAHGFDEITDPDNVPPMVYWVQAYPTPPRLQTRIPPHAQLSRRRLRNRLYRAGVKGAAAKHLLDQYAGRSRFRVAGEPDETLALSYPVRKAVCRHVQVMYLILDEFHAYVQPGLAELFAQARSFNLVPVEATQQLSDFAP